MARKPLIQPGSVLPPAGDASTDGGVLGRIIANDREKNGRVSPTHPGTETESSQEQNNQQPLTQISNEVSKTLSTQRLSEASKEVSTHVSKPVDTYSSTQRRRNPDAEVTQIVDDDLEPAIPQRRSAARSLSRSDKEPVTRLSIDVPQSMYERIKRYVFEHKIESTRALTLALYEDFLEEEGY